MKKILTLPPLSRTARRYLAGAWLATASGLLLGSGLVAALAARHHARALLGLALLLAGWLHLVELGVQRAFGRAGRRPAAARWLLRCYCGFVLTQGLGLAAGYGLWVRTGHLRHPGRALLPVARAAARLPLLASPF